MISPPVSPKHFPEWHKTCHTSCHLLGGKEDTWEERDSRKKGEMKQITQAWNQEIFRQLWASLAIHGGYPLNTDFLCQPLKCIWGRQQDNHTDWRYHQYLACSRTSISVNYLDLCRRRSEVQSIWDTGADPEWYPRSQAVKLKNSAISEHSGGKKKMPVGWGGWCKSRNQLC